MMVLACKRLNVYNRRRQHPPRIPLDLRTMGGYFFPGVEK